MREPGAHAYVLGRNRWIAALVVGLTYLAGAIVGHELSTPNAFATLWPPNAILVAALLVSPRWLWAYLVLATCPANLLFNFAVGQPLLVSLAYWMVNVAVSFAVAHLLLRFADPRQEPRRARSSLAFAAVTTLGTMLGGLAGGLATKVWQPDAAFVPLWLSWWMADLLAIVVLTPLLASAAVTWRAGRGVSRECRRFAVALGAVVLLTVALLLTGRSSGYLVQPLLIPLLGWAAVRLGVPATTWALLVTTVLTILNAVHGTGNDLLPEGFTAERAMALQAVLSGLSLTFVLISGAIADARDVEHDAQRREAARSELVATMTNEIRNPLGVILAAVQVIEREAGGGADRARPLRSIECAARQILDVAEDLIAAGRSAPASGEIVAETVWLPKLWKDLGEDCAKLPRPPAVDLRWKGPAPDVTLSTDRWRLEVVVHNLVMNALEFAERGTVTVACAVCDGGVVIVGRDTGCGVPPAEQRRNVDLGRRGGMTDAGAPRGGGVGLFTVTRFVAELGGSIALDSRLGVGSEFRVTLPLVSPVRHERGVAG